MLKREILLKNNIDINKFTWLDISQGYNKEDSSFLTGDDDK